MSYAKKNCQNCKYFAQGDTCSYCAHPNQTDESLKVYSYWIFSCDLFDKGSHQSRIEFTKKHKVGIID